MLEIFSNDIFEQRTGYSFEADWWALGIVVFEMMSGEQLYDISYQNVSYSHVREQLMARIHLSDIERRVGHADAADFIYRLNEKDPRIRLGNIHITYIYIQLI